MRRLWIITSLGIISLACVLMVSRSAMASYGAIYGPPYGNSSKAKDFALLKKDGAWYILSLNDPYIWPPPDQPESPGLPVATSYDLQHWSFVDVAVPHGDVGAWDSRAIWAPTIVKSGDTYYLYYAGVKTAGTLNTTYVQKIGMATSTDLVHWTKYSSNPVLDCSTLPWAHWDMSDTAYGSWYGADCRDPFVTRDETNNRWVMYFTARIAHDANPPYQDIPFPAVIGMATSTDLINWTDAGYIPVTAGPTAESAHVVEHNGTWYLIYTNNGGFQGTVKSLIYSTAPSMTGPFSGYADLPDVDSGHFASEYYQDADGTEYFGHDDNGTLRFSYVDWSSGNFGLRDIPQADQFGQVWNDINRNGLTDADEVGINGVKVGLYYDDGDNLFDATRDHLLQTLTTATLPVNSVRTPGVYRFQFLQAGRNWLAMPDQNFVPGGALFGLTPTTGNLPYAIDVTTSERYTGLGFGFALPDTTPPAAVMDLAAQ